MGIIARMKQTNVSKESNRVPGTQLVCYASIVTAAELLFHLGLTGIAVWECGYYSWMLTIIPWHVGLAFRVLKLEETVVDVGSTVGFKSDQL